MASLAVIYREGYVQMTDAAEFAIQYCIHGKMLGSFLLDIEDVGMATAAVQPFNVGLMWKDGRRDDAPFGLEDERLVKRDVLGPLFELSCRRNHSSIQGFAPVDPVAERGGRVGFLLKLSKLFRRISDVAVMALFAVSVGPESNSAVMARPAIPACPVICLGNLGCVDLHVEFQIGMANPAGEFPAVQPVGKSDRLDTFVGGNPVDENIAVFLGWRKGAQGINRPIIAICSDGELKEQHPPKDQ